MASQRSDLFDVVGELRECARRGDWQGAHQCAIALRPRTLPVDRLELAEYLNRLREALIVARTARAHTAATLVRLNAAAAFQRSRMSQEPRHEFGEVTAS